MTVALVEKMPSHSQSDSESDSSSIFDSAPSSPVSLKALKEDSKLQKSPPSKSAVLSTQPKSETHSKRPTTTKTTPPKLPMSRPSKDTIARPMSMMRSASTGHSQAKAEQQRRYSTMSADLRIPLSRRVNSLAEAEDRLMAARRMNSESVASTRVPRAANWQIPPHLNAQRRSALVTSKGLSRNATTKTTRTNSVDPSNVLKLKISCRETFDEIVALKLRKDRLRCSAELVEVILLKLAGKLPCPREKTRIALVFPNSALEPVTLKSPGGLDKLYNCECEEFMMNYVQAKSKIYVQVSS